MTENLFLNVFAVPTKMGLPMGVALFFTVFVFGLLRLFWILNDPTEQSTFASRLRIERTGPADSSKARYSVLDLSNRELLHLRLAIVTGIREAIAFGRMPDEMMRLTMRQADIIRTHFGLSPAELDSVPTEELRRYFHRRAMALKRLEKRIAASGEGRIDGITPLEMEHLHTSLEASQHIARIYGKLSAGRARRAVNYVKAMLRDLGKVRWDQWDKWLSNLPRFMRGHDVVLAAMLGRMAEG